MATATAFQQKEYTDRLLKCTLRLRMRIGADAKKRRNGQAREKWLMWSATARRGSLREGWWPVLRCSPWRAVGVVDAVKLCEMLDWIFRSTFRAETE